MRKETKTQLMASEEGVRHQEGRAKLAKTPSPHSQQPGKESPTREPGATLESEIERRQKLLAAYKSATGNPSNQKIYEAANSGINKPEFYYWRNGTIPFKSVTSINFERFLQDKKPPIPRKPRD